MSFTYQMVIQLSIGYRLSCTSFFYFYTAQQTEDKREKIQALSLAKERYSMKMDLLTNATVVDDAIRFVSQKSKEKLNHHLMTMKRTKKNQMSLIMRKTEIS
jgi:hypothetical protein